MQRHSFLKLFTFAVVGFAVIVPVLLVADSALAHGDDCDHSGGYGDDCIYIECDCDDDCGSSQFIGDPFCQNGDVYRNYRTATCLNPGTTDSECVVDTEPKLWYECESWETCSNGSCVENCSSHSYQQCSGNYLYWYDSCGNREEGQYCENGCYNNQCKSFNNITVQTNSATNISDNQATLNGYLYNDNSDCSAEVWFEYGPTTSYGRQTSQQQRYGSGNFSETIFLDWYNYNYDYQNYNNYHFRAVAEGCQGGTVYGQDRTFYIESGTGILTVNKTVRNLTSGSGFANTVYASPSDTLMFMITLQAPYNRSVSNVFVRDYFPGNLFYKDQLIVSGAGYSGDINSGIWLNGTISSGQTVTISYQAQLASAASFSYGTTTLNNSVSVSSSGNNANPSSNVSIVVTRTGVYGATTISTGLTNNFWTDSFFLPLLISLLGIWLWRSGLLFGMEKWLLAKNKTRRQYFSEKKLSQKIAQIQKLES